MQATFNDIPTFLLRIAIALEAGAAVAAATETARPNVEETKTEKATPAASEPAATRERTAKAKPADAQKADKAPAIDYATDIGPRIVALANAAGINRRDLAIALLKKFDVKSGKDLTSDQYPGVVAELDRIYAELDAEKDIG